MNMKPPSLRTLAVRSFCLAFLVAAASACQSAGSARLISTGEGAAGKLGSADGGLGGLAIIGTGGGGHAIATNMGGAPGVTATGIGGIAGTAGTGSGGTTTTGDTTGSGGTPAAGGMSGSGGSSGGAGAGGSPSDAASWYPQDLSFTSKGNKANPYLDVTDFTVTFTGPAGETLTVPGFYTGNQVWKVRFAPTSAGAFTYATSSVQDPTLNGLTGTVPAARANPNGHGAVQVDPAYPHHYLNGDGTRYFQMGYEIDWLALMDFGDVNITKAKTLIDMVAANGFTEVNLQIYAYDTSWKPGITSAYDFGPTADFPWAGTNAAPDNTRMNEAFWQNYDRVIAYLFEKGLNAHIFFKFVRTYGANELVGWPAKGSAEDDLYFRFVTARYQAYANIFWDLIKESYEEPDQVYIADRLTFVRSVDAYHHMRTLHDSDGGQSQYSPNYYDVASHKGTVEFYTDQQTNQYAAAVAAWKKRAMPYLNAEVTLYQIGNDGTYAYKGNPKEAVFATNMEVLMAGGYFSYYYSLQAWDVVRWKETPAGIEWYKNLAAFVETTGWFKMTANDALIGGGAIGLHCLANPGKEYIVFKAGAGSVTLAVAGAQAPLSAKWIDLYTGAQTTLADQGNGARTFTNPSADPGFVYLVAH
ncbi:MAG TPA: DUF5060 domain-containing protein [Polyangia bacterium]|nr:DUF5060 domain-containing protein [Polyangia bacterium]